MSADATFSPNLVNTVCFLAQNAVQLIIFAVNYVGEPFQTPLPENKGMVMSIRTSSAALLLLASGVAPAVNEAVQLVPIPPALRVELLSGAAAVAAACFTIERAARALFPAPRPPRKGYMALLHLLPDAVRKKNA